MTSTPGLQRLFQPLQVGRMTIKNRLMMSCMAAGTQLDDDGHVTDEMIGYYVERAKSCPGQMGIGAGSVMPQDQPKKTSPCLHADEYIPTLRRLTDAVHQFDTKFGIQLWEGGIQAGGRVQLSPSGVTVAVKAVGDQTLGAPVVKALSQEEIKVVRRFGDAAERCVKAGFDFVEIHAGHGYLISTFMTPFFNRRTDQYGGSFENRIRFLIEILRTVKERVGQQITVGVKTNGDDCLPEQGWTLADACRLAPILEREGADYLTISAGVMGAPRLTVPPLYEPQGCFADFAREVRKQVKIPVYTTGRIKNPRMAEELIRNGTADVCSIGRPIIADPAFVAKARDGMLADIRPCLAECRGCLDQQMRTIMRGEKPVTSCIVNPRVGREVHLPEVAGDRKSQARRVLVIGGGIAGLEAARRAAYSGHIVTLCERRGWLGGQVRFAAMMPQRHEIGDILPWYERQLNQLGVDVRLNTEVDGALLDQLRPAVVVIATGSVPTVPQNFTDSLYNCTRIAVHMADDVLEDGRSVGDHILIVGGEQIGMTMADYLSEGGRTVYVAEEHSHFASKLAANDRWYLVGRTRKKNVKQFKNIHRIDVTESQEVWLRGKAGDVQLPRVDSIVLASERQSDRSMLDEVKRRGIEVHVIGDAKDLSSEDGGTIFANVAQAYDVARHL
jgi:2,4-dienoyl-CoA reductase-like NADH-dependent reductase (Old Yellow Enzyme family)/thioredoxin reductase